MVHDPRVSHQLARLGGVYRDPARVDRDASSLLRSSVGSHLTPITATHVETNGSSSTVLVLQGTIAIHFRGNTYQLLVDIYLVSKYPMRPPVCYVRLADASMYLKPNHKHVGSDGKVYLPYLHEWNGSTHNLVELVVAMSSVFSAEPPVFSRPTPPPPPPPPVQQQPPPPPLPVVGGGSYANVASQTGLGTAHNNNERWQQEQLEALLAKEAEEANRAAEAARNADREDQERLRKQQEEEEAREAQKRWEEARTNEVRQQLQSKIKQYCREQAADIQQQVQQDWKDQQALSLSTENKVDGQIETLEKLKRELERQCQVVTQCKQDIEEWLADHENNNNNNGAGNSSSNNGGKNRELSIDEVVAPATALEGQMIKLAADNAAFQDVLYFLDRALYSGHMDCDAHLKHVRQVAKQQFFVRALLLKIQQLSIHG